MLELKDKGCYHRRDIRLILHGKLTQFDNLTPTSFSKKAFPGGSNYQYHISQTRHLLIIVQSIFNWTHCLKV